MKIKKIISSALALAIAVTGLPFLDVSAENKSWRELYRERLYEMKNSPQFNEKYTFDLYDINADDIPELFILSGNHSCAELYTVSDEKLIHLSTFTSESGESVYINYRPDTNRLIVNQNYDTITLFTLEGAELILNDKFEKSGNSDYTLNGEPAEYETYAEMTYGARISLGWKYNFGDMIIEYALTPQKDMTDEQKKLYLEKLCQLKALYKYDSENNEPIDSAQFEICDLSGDGIAELSVSPSTSFAAGACNVYTVNGEELSDLGYIGVYGDFRYNAQKNLVYCYFGRMGSTHGEYFSIENGKRQTKINFYNDEDYVEVRNEYALENGEEELLYAEYRVNDKNVTMEEYYSLTEEFTDEENSMYCGRRNILSSRGIAEAVFGEASLIPMIMIAADTAGAVPINTILSYQK